MEILIRLAGVQLGPYSEQQVRQHLEDGLLSVKDSAKFEDTEDWMPLGELLAGALVAPEPLSELPTAEEEIQEAPRRAPSTPPGVTHIPAGHPNFSQDPPLPDVSTLDKKTMLLGPTAPRDTPSAGQSSSSISSTSPLAPKNQITKKVSRANLIKALAQTTAPLPTKAIQALAARRPAKIPTIPESPSQANPSSLKAPPEPLAQSLTAKTVPMRATPAAPPLPAMLPITAPMPSRAPVKPASDSVPPPSSPISALTKRLNQMVQPDAGPTPPLAAEEEVEVPTTKLDAPPILFKGKSTKDTKATEETKAESQKAPAVPVSTPIPPPVPDKVDESSDEPHQTAPRPRLLPKIAWAWGALALFTLYYVWSPYHASSSLRYALDAGVSSELDARIDFPAVRASLKDQVNAQMSQSGVPSAAAASVVGMLNHSIDVYVTPDGIAALVTKSDSFGKENLSQLILPDVAEKILLAFNNEPVRNEGLASVTDFISNRDAALLRLRFQGLGWKLKRVDLRPDLLTRASDGSIAPLIAPVVDTYLERSRTTSKSSDSKEAVADLTQVLAIDPRSSVAYNDRANIRQAKGDLGGAISDYTQALTIDPQMATAYNGRGNARAAKNDLAAAIADFTEAVRLDPTMAVAYDSRGNAKTAKDDLEGAIADFTQAITIDPNLASAYSDRGFARQANGNADGAIADYTQALALKPNTARAYFNRGLARQTQGNIDAAIIDFDRALAFDPKIADAYYYRGNAKSTNHDLDGAIADYNSALALNPRIASAYGNRGLARQAKGDLEGAASDYSQALILDPKNASAYFNRALIEAQKNDLDNAIADSTQALYLEPKNALAYYTRGFAKLTKGNLDGALTDLKQFCDLAPRDHNADHARLYLWLIAKAQNSSVDADQDLSSALESSWNSSADDLTTKTASFLLGRLDETGYLAAATSPDAKTDQAQHCESWYFAGMKRLLMGDKKGAIDAFQQCIATNQKDFCEYVLAQAELQALATPPPVAAPVPVAVPVKPAGPAVKGP